MTFADINTQIITGEVDDDLDLISMAIQERRRSIAQGTFAQLVPNVTRVRIQAGHLKTKYLDGATALVTAKRLTKIEILFDDDIHDPYGKWAGKKCILNPQHVEIIEPGEEV